jgi:hypothetical protein
VLLAFRSWSNSHSISDSPTLPRVRDSLFAYISNSSLVLHRTIDQRQSESTNYKPDYISFNSGKSCLYRFGSLGSRFVSEVLEIRAYEPEADRYHVYAQRWDNAGD